MLFALSVYKIHRIMLHALKLPDQYWKFKTIPHREFSKEDKLLIRLCYQHSYNAVYIAVYKTHFLFYPYTPMSIPNRRCTTKITKFITCIMESCRLRLEGTFEDTWSKLLLKTGYLDQGIWCFSRSLGQTLTTALLPYTSHERFLNTFQKGAAHS